VVLDPAEREADLSLTTGVEEVFAAADAFDYRAAAEGADALHARLRAGCGSPDPHVRPDTGEADGRQDEFGGKCGGDLRDQEQAEQNLLDRGRSAA